MPSILKTLRAAADPTRLRILLLLKAEELSVAELQEILTLGQSTISTHLSQLKQARLVEDRRAGKNILYRLAGGDPGQAAAGPGSEEQLISLQAAAETNLVDELLARAAADLPESAQDSASM